MIDRPTLPLRIAKDPWKLLPMLVASFLMFFGMGVFEFVDAVFVSKLISASVNFSRFIGMITVAFALFLIRAIILELRVKSGLLIERHGLSYPRACKKCIPWHAIDDAYIPDRFSLIEIAIKLKPGFQFPIKAGFSGNRFKYINTGVDMYINAEDLDIDPEGLLATIKGLVADSKLGTRSKAN